MSRIILSALAACLSMAAPAAAQKTWTAPAAYGLDASEKTANPGLDLIDILPAGMDKNIGAWDWVDDDKVVFTNWIRNPPAIPSGDIWMMTGLRSRDKAKIAYKRYFAGNLREPLGVKVVNGEVYVAVKFALLKMVDANKDGIAEDTVQVATFPHKLEPSETWNHYSMDVKYRGGFFYVALPSETVAYGYPGYPVTPGRGTVARIDPATHKVEYLCSGLRTPDGLGWGPDSALFVTDNQGAWLPSSKLIHVTKNRFFGLQPVEAGDPSLVESPPAVWMPHKEASSSPTQPMLLAKGPYAGQFLIGDNVLGVINRAALEQVKGEWQGALFHFTGSLTCGTHRLLQDADGTIYFGGLGSPINTWNVKDHFVGMQAARFNDKPAFEVKEILSRADGFTLRFTAPAGASAEDPANYKLRQWRYQPTKEYGGNKLDPKDLPVAAVQLDASRTLAHLQVAGLLAGRVVDFQFHKDLQSAAAQPIWTGEAWYTLNQISAETSPFPTAAAPRAGEVSPMLRVLRGPAGMTVAVPAGFVAASAIGPGGRVYWTRNVQAGSLAVPERELPRGMWILELRRADGGTPIRQALAPW